MEKVMKIFKRLFKFSLKMFLRAQRFVKKSITRSFFIFVQTVELSTLTPGAMITTINLITTGLTLNTFETNILETYLFDVIWCNGLRQLKSISLYDSFCTLRSGFSFFMKRASLIFRVKFDLYPFPKILKSFKSTFLCFVF